ncbi:MAG: acyl-ACP--UDP-N-acetylglucosamine O-acyltransferase [Candidatus Firestonebacteria bacterium]|nr:acyl-ACP--UDP-N-acetylglucosamine O-acyltransferase [Candidatus Firestonebacteria bacterium]
MFIHSTAIVHPKAILGENVEIGPYAIIGENANIGNNSKVMANANIDGWTYIGENCQVFPGAIIGIEPQDISYKGQRSYVRIGNNNIIREYVTIHRSKYEEGETRLGDNNYIMATAHIAHDCIIGNGVIIVNYSAVTGHVVIEDRAFISGMAGIHQFVRIGEMAMIGGMAKVTQDVPPYITVDGYPAKPFGLNTVGLKRNNVPLEIRNVIKLAYKIIYHSGLNLSQAIEKIENEIPKSREINHFVEFIKKSDRGICK